VISRRGFFSVLAAPFLIRAVGHENSIQSVTYQLNPKLKNFVPSECFRKYRREGGN